MEIFGFGKKQPQVSPIKKLAEEERAKLGGSSLPIWVNECKLGAERAHLALDVIVQVDSLPAHAWTSSRQGSYETITPGGATVAVYGFGRDESTDRHGSRIEESGFYSVAVDGEVLVQYWAELKVRDRDLGVVSYWPATMHGFALVKALFRTVEARYQNSPEYRARQMAQAEAEAIADRMRDAEAAERARQRDAEEQRKAEELRCKLW